MSKRATMPMDSYRLAQYAVQVPCYICGEGNSFDGEYCRTCSAPMALAHQSNSQKVNPMMIAAIGASGAGKTVYLGMLMDMLSRRKSEFQALARGAFSISLQQNTISALEQCRFPEKTPSEPDRWNWVHCQIRSRKHRRTAEMIVPDMAGEAIMEEINHPKTYTVIRSLLTKCSAVMVLVDASQIERGKGDQDFFTMKLLSYLSELDDDPKTGWCNRPVAVLFSKADMNADCLNDPELYAKQHMRGLWEHCNERYRRHAFFAAGVAGACVYRAELGVGAVQVPLRIEPRGVTEPFEWIIRQLKF